MEGTASGEHPAQRSTKERPHGRPGPAGSDVSAGTYRCTSCSYELGVRSTSHLPPRPKCGNGSYDTLSGGDSVDDPQNR
jgi:hypothetical protein